MRLLWFLRRAPLAIEAALSLCAASLAIKLSGKARTVRLLGGIVERSERSVPPPDRRARTIAGAVSRVAELLPWHPACLPRAIATRWMLRRRGIECEAHLGIVSVEPFAAHAWVSVRGEVVQGGPVTGMAELARLR